MPEIFKKRLNKEIREPEKDKGLYVHKQAELLGDFFDKVVPNRIAVEIVKDYKREIKKGVSGVNKKKYEDPVEYEKAVRDVSDKISRVFKIFEEKISGMDRVENWRDEALVNKIELDNVFEGKNIVFAVKEGDVAKKEYKNMLKFKEFLPDNSPKIYDYQRVGKDGVLVTEKIEGKTLSHLLGDTAYKNIETALRAKPELFFDLGKITAIMDNNNFVHGDLHFDNILLSEDYVWKLIDFELSRNHKKKREAIKFFTNVEHVVLKEIINEISNKFKNKPIKDDFYEGYLLNRNFKEDIRFVAKEKLINFKNTKEYIGRMLGTIENISAPSKETRNYLDSLINEIDWRLKEPGKDETETKTFKKRTEILKDFKQGLGNFLEKKVTAN